MEVDMRSRNRIRRALLLAACASTAACSPPDKDDDSPRLVRGQLDLSVVGGLDVPNVVAQNMDGQTFDGAVTADGSFSLLLPSGKAYRLFVTDLRASGRQSAESRVLWPGGQKWATIPSGSGSTQDGPAG